MDAAEVVPRRLECGVSLSCVMMLTECRLQASHAEALRALHGKMDELRAVIKVQLPFV